MHTKAMSTGVSLASRCASVTCSARTGTENSATSLAWVTRRPCFLMCSICSGHGSMNVTSSPACTIWAPAYPPTAPAPTIAIFRPMLSSRHSWQPRLARRPGSSQRLNRVAPGARRYSFTRPRSPIQQFRLTDLTKQHFPRLRNAGYAFSAHRILCKVQTSPAPPSIWNVSSPAETGAEHGLCHYR
jgi:hypothetical protein